MSSYFMALFWASVIVYGFAAVLAIWGVLLRQERVLDWAVRCTIIAFVPHAGALVLRWAAAGRPPVVGPFENTIVGAWAIILGFLILSRRYPRMKITAAVAVPFVLLTLGYSATISSAIPAYLPAYKSNWLITHVVFAWITYATYSLTAAIAAAELLKTRATRHVFVADADEGAAEGATAGRAGAEQAFKAGFWGRVPPIPALQDMAFRLVVLGFLTNAVMIVTGAIWAYKLWGSYWAWDAVETWSLVTWLAYGLYLHLKLTLKWSGPRLAWIAVVALVGIAMVFWGVQLVPSTYHLFRQMGAGRLQGLQ